MLRSILKLFFWSVIATTFVLLIFVLKTEFSVSSSTALKVWVQNGMERISLDDPPQDARSIHLYAARGEYESFQIGINAPRSNFSLIDVEISDLTSTGDRSISQQNITLYREHYVHVTKPSPTWRGSKIKPLGKGWYPDGLIPFTNPETGAKLDHAELDAVPFKLKQGTNQPIWVDIFVPRDALAGNYRGTYTVTGDRGKTTGKILLTVWDFELPLKPSLKSAFLSWDRTSKNTMIELLKHRVMPAANFSPKNERELIDQWGLSSVRLPFWSGADYQTCTMNPPPSSAKIREAGLRHQLDLELYVYPTDEIDDCKGLREPFKAWSKNILQAGVKHMAVMAPVAEFFDLVDIWVVNPERYDKAGDKISQVLRQGKEVWFYTFHASGGSVPNWQIDFEPINFRIPQGFINQSLGLTGLLYWRVDGWTDDPWNDVDTSPHPTEPKHYPGDGMLVYPGEQVGVKGVVPSMRLKWIREGVEDYEYIEILKRWGYEDWAMKTVRQVATDMHHWNNDPAVLSAARKKLGEKIHQLAS